MLLHRAACSSLGICDFEHRKATILYNAFELLGLVENDSDWRLLGKSGTRGVSLTKGCDSSLSRDTAGRQEIPPALASSRFAMYTVFKFSLAGFALRMRLEPATGTLHCHNKFL